MARAGGERSARQSRGSVDGCWCRGTPDAIGALPTTTVFVRCEGMAPQDIVDEHRRRVAGELVHATALRKVSMVSSLTRPRRMIATLEAEVIAREHALLRAVTTNDVALLDDLLHDDLLFNGPDGQTATKAVDLANYRSGGVQLRRADASDRLVSVIGDVVVVAVTVALEGSYLGVQVDGRFRYMRVWKRTDGAWRVIAGSVV